MTLKELRKIITEHEQLEWFSSLVAIFDFPHLKIKVEKKGVSDIYKYIDDQVNGWEQLTNLPDILINSKKYFSRVKRQFDIFIEYVKNRPTDLPAPHWNDVRNAISNQNKIFPFDAPQVKFLLDIYINNPESFTGAYGYIIKEVQINSVPTFEGMLLAYEFSQKGNPLTNRRDAEKSSLIALKNEFQKYQTQSESSFREYMSDIYNQFTDHTKSFDDFKSENEKSFLDWFKDTQKSYKEFLGESTKAFKEIEALYADKLKFEKPAEYWKKRSLNMKRQGRIALGILVGLVLLVAVQLICLLWNVPEELFKSFIGEDKSAAIRWSIIFITFLSFMLIGIRAVSKVMFSSFHLASDCEERYTMTYFYLSLLNDDKVVDQDRQLIIQSLFSRAETGLLNNDSSPTMPNDIIGKVLDR